MWWCNNAVNFLENTHIEHPMARPLGPTRGCLLCVLFLIQILSRSSHVSSQLIGLYNDTGPFIWVYMGHLSPAEGSWAGWVIAPRVFLWDAIVYPCLGDCFWRPSPHESACGVCVCLAIYCRGHMGSTWLSPINNRIHIEVIFYSRF